MTNGLAVADYAIIAGFFAVLLGIGFYFRGRMKSLSQFFGGGKQVPWWLAEDYPALFDGENALERVRLYSIAYDVRDLLLDPPRVPVKHLSRLHAYHRLEDAVRGESYLDELAEGRMQESQSTVSSATT